MATVMAAEAGGSVPWKLLRGAMSCVQTRLTVERKIHFAVYLQRYSVAGMNPQQQAIEDARRAGFDIDLLDSNLALTPAERWRQHNLALEMALELQQARLVRDPKLRPAAPSPR